MSLSPDDVRRLALKEFAALTRHGPAALDNKFGMSMVVEGAPLDQTVRLGLALGAKYKASTEFAADALEWEANRFCDEILKPLALQLRTSKEPMGA
jgi:hypothetical protein